VTVTVTESGNGTVTSSPAGISCPGTCSAAFVKNSSVVLTAKSSGLGNRFSGWTGDCSSNGFVRTCTLSATVARSATATFVTESHNVSFVSSATYAANLGSASAYDAQCNALATAAGLNNVSADGFIAWVSSSSSKAVDRLGSAHGFVRVDGHPFADNLA